VTLSKEHEISQPRFCLRSFSARTLMASSTSPLSSYLSFIDIGANLLDERFTEGDYRGTHRHDPDLDLVMERAASAGVRGVVLTAGTVDESRRAVETARKWRQRYGGIRFGCTVGVHPTRCRQVFEPADEDDSTPRLSPDDLLKELLEIALDGMKDGTVVAIGEIGLDYDRLEFCPKGIQQSYLVKQLQILAAPTKLPLFLHNRSVGTDLYDILREHSDCWKGSGGVVHSYDDDVELATNFINELGLYIGLNGCSLKTSDNLHVVRELPLDRILLETDCPYCEIRPTHAGFSHVTTKFEAKAEKKFERGKLVKNRQEPCHIVQVAEVVAGCKDLTVREVAAACYDNTLRLYSNWKEQK